MSYATAPYERVPIEEVVPESMKLSGLARSSVLTGRRRVRIVPQSGQTYSPATGTTLANILIQDSAGMIDLQSAVLSFRLKTSSASGSLDPAVTAVPDDFAWSVLRRMQVSLNSVLVDDVDYVAKRATAEAYGSASKAWYDSVGTAMGAWKFRGDGCGFGANGQRTAVTVPRNDVGDKLALATKEYKNVLWDSGAAVWAPAAADGGGKYFSIPLGMLSHFFRQEALFSLRNAGQLYVQLLFAPNEEALFNNKNSDPASYQVTECVLECDIVTAHPSYTDMVDEICSRPESEGLAYAYDAHLVSVQQVTSAVSQQNTFTVIASKATQNCRQLSFVQQPQAALSSQGYLSQSTFNANNTNQWQIRIGSVYYPAFPSQGLSKNFMEVLSAYNAPMASVGQGCLLDLESFSQTTSSAEIASDPAYTQTNNWSTLGAALPDNGTFAFADKYIGAYCFDNLKHAEVLSHDGVNTLAMSGSQIQLEIRCTPIDANTAITYFIRFTRTVLLAENGVQIIG